MNDPSTVWPRREYHASVVVVPSGEGLDAAPDSLDLSRPVLGAQLFLHTRARLGGQQMASQKVKKEQKGSAKQTSTHRAPKPSKDDLERMVEEATVDAYNESEQVCGFYTMLENDLELPF